MCRGSHRQHRRAVVPDPPADWVRPAPVSPEWGGGTACGRATIPADCSTFLRQHLAERSAAQLAPPWRFRRPTVRYSPLIGRQNSYARKQFGLLGGELLLSYRAAGPQLSQLGDLRGHAGRRRRRRERWTRDARRVLDLFSSPGYEALDVPGVATRSVCVECKAAARHGHVQAHSGNDCAD